ncbi:MAG: efflux RND transporter periplasmic adaptor subunit [Planctomycetes bacterium]|nr:efflux RND transporter periplasmic adaptor subunit [Planctomycetota bacterium]
MPRTHRILLLAGLVLLLTAASKPASSPDRSGGSEAGSVLSRFQPGITVETTYPGANARALEDMVAEPIEQQVKSRGLTDLGLRPEDTSGGQVAVEVDHTARKLQGVSRDELSTALQLSRGPLPIGHFNRFGRSWAVNLQVDAGRASGVKDILRQLKVHNGRGQLVPLTNLVRTHEGTEPGILVRFFGFPMVEITANPAPGMSLGETRWLCETLAEEARLALGLSAEYQLTWLQELPAAKSAPDRKKTTGPPNPPPEVVVSQPLVRAITDSEEFTGVTGAVSTVKICPRVSGYLAKAPFQEGAEVKEGDLLFEIDPRPYKATLDQAAAALESARASATLAEATYKRTLALVQNHAASAQDADRDRADLEAARAKVAQAQAGVQAAQLHLDFTRILSPISGRIGQRLVDPGNLVKAEETILATVLSQDPMYVYFDADEPTLLRLRRLVQEQQKKSLQEAKVPVWMGLADDQGYPHEGALNFVDNQVDTDTGTMRMRAVFNNPGHVLAAGLFVRVRVAIGAPHQALLVPERALGVDHGQEFLYVIKDQNEVAYRKVVPGARLEGLRVIETGLQPGERVVVTGLKRVRPGMRVKPREVPLPGQTPAPGKEKEKVRTDKTG